MDTDGYLGNLSFRGCVRSANLPTGIRTGGEGSELPLSSFLGDGSSHKLHLGLLQPRGLALDRGDWSRSGVMAFGPVAVLQGEDFKEEEKVDALYGVQKEGSDS